MLTAENYSIQAINLSPTKSFFFLQVEKCLAATKVPKFFGNKKKEKDDT